MFDIEDMFFQGYLFGSTVDYLTTEPDQVFFVYLLLCSAWLLPNILIFSSHIIVIAIYR